MRLLHRILEKILNKILGNITIDYIRVRRIAIGSATLYIKSDRISFPSLTSDPTEYQAGDLWFNASDSRLKYSPDGTAVSSLAPAPVSTGDIADGAVTSAKIANGAVTSDKIADSAVTSAKIADGAVTDAKITGPISPSKIGEGDLNLGTGTLTCGQVNVGDILLKYGWKIVEKPDRLLILKDNRIVLEIPAQAPQEA